MSIYLCKSCLPNVTERLAQSSNMTAWTRCIIAICSMFGWSFLLMQHLWSITILISGKHIYWWLLALIIRHLWCMTIMMMMRHRNGFWVELNVLFRNKHNVSMFFNTKIVFDELPLINLNAKKSLLFCSKNNKKQ